MKLLIAVLILIWFACGLFGAMRLNEVTARAIIRGPITMVRAFNEAPVSYSDN